MEVRTAPLWYRCHQYRASSTRPGCERLPVDATALSFATVRWRGDKRSAARCTTSEPLSVSRWRLSQVALSALSRYRFRRVDLSLFPDFPAGALRTSCRCSLSLACKRGDLEGLMSNLYPFRRCPRRGIVLTASLALRGDSMTGVKATYSTRIGLSMPVKDSL